MGDFLCLTNATGVASSAIAGEGTGMDFTAVYLIISLIVAIVLPVSILLFGKIKCNGSFIMTLKGMAGYLLFYVILSAFVAMLLLRGYSDQNATYFEVSVYVVIQFLCLELGRYILLRMSGKKRGQWGDALMFSGGYCICDTLVIAVFFLVPYLIIVLSPDGGSIDGLLREMRVYVKDSNLVPGKEWRFIVKALTSLVFCAMQMSSTLLMHIAIAKKERWMIVLPVIIDALIMIPNRLSVLNVWYFGNNFVIIPYLAVIAVLSCLFTFMMYKKVYKRQEVQVDTSYFDKIVERK